MELYWELASRLSGVVTIVVTGLLYGRFITPFLYNQKAVRPVKMIYIGTMSALYFVPYILHGLLAHAFGTLVFLIAIYLYDRRNAEQKIFLALFLYLTEWISWGIIMAPKDFLFRLDMYWGAVFELTDSVYLGLYLLIQSGGILFRYFLMRFLLDIMNRIYLYKNENMSRKELGLMLAIPLSSITGYYLSVFFSDIYLEDTSRYIQDMHSSYQWIVALYQIISYAALVAAVIFYQDMKKNHRREKENAVLAGQVESLKKHIGEVETLYRDIRGIRHDMGNHIMILEGLFQKDRQEEAIGYLAKLKEQLHEAETEMKTGNPVTDILLTEKKKEAESRGITFRCEFCYPEESEVNAFDISIILNNALDNAIEGVEGCMEPFIRIASYREKNIYMIEVANSLKERIFLEEESGLPQTMKEKNGEHGYGLNNIRRVAQKYFGDLDIEQRDNMFLLQVMLLLEVGNEKKGFDNKALMRDE